MEVQINWIAVIVATLVPLVVGFIWYHKALFGMAWMKASGVTEEHAKQANMVKMFGTTIILSFLCAFFLLANTTLGTDQQDVMYHTFKHGVLHGVILGSMVGLPVLGINAVFEMKSWKYIFINVGYWLVCFAVMGGILSAWR